MNRPRTLEGAQVWDLVLRLGGQIRAVPGAVLGWDLGAALAMARALGVDLMLAAEILPELEPVMVRAANAALQRDRGEDGGL